MTKRFWRWVSYAMVCGLCALPGSGCLPGEWLNATFSSLLTGGTANVIHGSFGQAL
ncbi:MAG: hypothetical protein ACE5GE_04675 [Phycisphaerae bacterium]